MRAKLLLGCFEVPGWGGASTFTYTLFEHLQRDGIAVELVNLVADHDVQMLRDLFGGPEFGNPYALDGVQTCFLAAPLYQAQGRLADAIRAARADLLVACGYIGAWLMKHAAPELPLAFITSGSAQVKRLLREHAIDDYVGFERSIARGITFTAPEGDRERAAVEASDLIIVHSPHVRVAYEHFFPRHMGKVYENLISIADCVYAEAARHADLALPFTERDIDAIFVASNWLRPEKNYPLLRRIATDCGGTLHVVGANVRDPLPVHSHGVVTGRKQLYALLGRSKTIVCPSAWDPAPGVLFEASAMGCNVVASRNCGNWQLCHDQLLADSPDAFITAIRRATAMRYADKRARFRGGYADLVDTLRAFL